MKRLAITLAAFLVLGGTAQAYDATVKYTQYGNPHITGKNFGDLGFGDGYAFAKGNICTMADQYVTVRAQRSKFFGSDGTYVQRGNGTTVKNLDSDFFWQRIINDRVVEQLMERKPPLGPRDDIRAGVRGYVAGWNKYLDDAGGADGISDPNCKGKPWVTKITELDAYRRFYQLILLASQAVAIDGIANAAPVPGTFAPPAANPLTVATELKEVFPKGGIGSNAGAIGSDGLQNDKGSLLLGNPHFPWLGTERFYQFQMTIPKKVNVSGAGLFGVPLALIGYTDNLAWSHTVSTAYRFTPFQLTIDPTDNKRYIVDGQSEAMTPKNVTVDLGDGRTSKRTLWWTRYGPVFTSLLGIPLPWTNAEAFAMKDANEDNFRAFNHFIATDQAQSTQELLGVLKRYQGIPWVNTIAADRKGNALYADIGAVPGVSDALVANCNTPLGQATFALARLPVLDGSRSACEWENDPQAIEPGLLGREHQPHLFRSDYVTNSNDSYWLSNPHQPLTGFPRIRGDAPPGRSLRTRIGLIMTQDIVDHGGFTRQKMQDMVFSDRQDAGELTRDSLVAMCREMQLGAACDTLASWDLHENTSSRGALLFRRFWERAAGATPSPWVHPFDANHPV